MAAADLRVLLPLSRAWRAKATGAFSLTGGGSELKVFLQNGQVAHVEGLPALLASVAPAGTVLTGSLLQDLGAVVARGVGFDGAMAAAGDALGRALASATEMPNTRSGFNEGIAPPAGAFPLSTPLPRLLAQGLKQVRKPEQLARTLNAQAQHKLIVFDQSATEGLDPAAMRVLQRGRSGPRLEELLTEARGKGPAREEETHRALDLVIQLGLAELQAPPKPVGPTPEERAAELNAQAAALRAMRPLHALGLAEVPADQINREKVQSAFRARASAMHPDRYAAEVEVVREAAADLFAALNDQAAKVAEADPLLEEVKRLTAEQRGEVYVSDTDRERARVGLRKALQAEKARSWQAAFDYVIEAKKVDPYSVELQLFELFYSCILKLRPIDDAVPRIDGLKFPNDRFRAEASFRVGWLLRLADRPDQALARFHKAVELNPQHTEAQREARLAKGRTEAAAAKR